MTVNDRVAHADDYTADDPASSSGLPTLVCPQHGGDLHRVGQSLMCASGHDFPIDKGIPRIVVDWSTYADSFGEQWNRYRRTQLDSYTRTTISTDRLRACLGPALWKRLESRHPTQVLEAGCGAGRFTEALLELPGTILTSTDLTVAVDVNAANCPPSERHALVQCDINALPFRHETFDIVICLGVIQHTPEPETTIQHLYSQVRPGGWLIIDHYSASLAYYTKIGALALRPLLRRLPGRARLRVTESLVKVFLPYHRAARRSPLAQYAVSRVSPVLTYYRAHPELSDDLQYEWALLDTHDSLTDYYKHFRNVDQINRILADLGAVDIRCVKGGNGVEARCRRPA